MGAEKAPVPIRNSRKTAAPPEEFVRIWQTAEVLEDVADKLGTTIASAVARAKHFRKLTIPLKELKKRGGVDVEKLRALAIELMKSNGKIPEEPPEPRAAVPELMLSHIASFGAMTIERLAKDIKVDDQRICTVLRTHHGWFTKGGDGLVRLSVTGVAEAERRQQERKDRKS